MPSCHSTQNRGFALIIALLLMAFVLLLLLSITTLMRVETRNAAQVTTTTQARQNALLGLQEALGQLQATAGPDQRVTATGSLSATAGTGTEHLVGVWNSEDTNGDGMPDGSFERWLVSRADPTEVEDRAFINADMPIRWSASDSRYVIASAAVNDHVILVGAGSTQPDPNNSGLMQGVVAQKKDLLDADADVSGRYAWWVGDEGVKARVNLTDPESSANPNTAEGRMRLAVPARTGLEAMNIGSNFLIDQIPDFSQDNKLFDRVDSVQALPLAFNSGSQGDINQFIKERFHEVTTRSVGLMTNTKEGGLKRDLTYTIGMSNSDWDRFENAVDTDGDNRLYPSAGTTNSITDPGGPQWAQLRSFLDQSIAPSANYDPEAAEGDSVGIAPVVLRVVMGVTASVADTGANRKLRVHYAPLVILWNPYDVPIAADDYYLAFGHPYMYQQLRIDIERPAQTDLENVYAGSTDGKMFSGDQDAADAYNRNNLIRNAEALIPTPPQFQSATNNNPHAGDRPYHFMISSSGILPGEAVVFTPTSSDEYTKWPSWGNVLTAGYRPGENYYFTMPELVNVMDDTSAKQAIRDGSPITSIRIQVPDDRHETAVIMALDPFDIGTGIDLGGEEATAGPPDELVFYARQISWVGDTTTTWGTGGTPTGFNITPYNVTTPALDQYAFGYFFGLRMCEESQMGTLSNEKSLPSRWLAHYNPRALIFSRSVYDDNGPNPNTGYGSIPIYAESMLDQSDFATMYEPQWASVSAPVTGFSSFYPNGPQRSVLFRVFQDPSDFTSIGDLMHANLYQIPALGTHGALVNSSRGNLAGGLYPAFAIGNSLMPPYLPLGSTDPWRNQWPGRAAGSPGWDQSNTHTYYDHSYQLNEALWDGFYFSSRKNPNSSVDDFRNPRMTLLDSVSTSDHATPTATHDLAAARLGVTGAFNVNSTSVEAWKAVLASFLDIDAPNETSSRDESFWTRVERPQGSSYNSSQDNASAASAHSGIRKLSITELENLATEIVSAIKSRGNNNVPFLTLAQFVNRELGASGDRELKGVLQEGIDNSNINSGLAANVGNVDMDLNAVVNDNNFSAVNMSRYNLSATVGARGFGLPGFIMQADLLAKLGSLMTVRSDTFVVRAYGEANNPLTGESETQAWCEAIVQRVPYPVDPVSGNTNEPNYWNNDTGFGRQFKVVHFRWLDRDEI